MTSSLSRPLLSAIAAALALTLTACGGSTGADETRSAFEREGDRGKGSASAPVVMIEYLSVSCGACAGFHTNVNPTLERYIADGTLRLVYREMLTPPPELALAGFLLARCVSEDRYFDMVGLMLEQQQAIFMAARRGEARQQYQTIARSAGLSDEQFRTCMSDEGAVAALNEANQQAARDGIGVTPSFVINGVRLESGRAPDGSGLVYFAGGEPIEDERGFVPEQFSDDSFSRIIEYFRSRAAE